MDKDIIVKRQDDEEMGNMKDWVGTSLKDIYRGHSPWQFEIPLIRPSKYHAILYEAPYSLQSPPTPRHSGQLRHWENDFVRLPYSPKNLFPAKKSNGKETLTERWILIKEALTKRPITSSEDLEAAIHSYNTRLPKFLALHFYLNEILEDYEVDHFFTSLLPGIVHLALQLPDMVCASIPLLTKGSNKSVTLSQMQIACLLANAFLCTFPWRRDMNTYPGVNFVRLFSSHFPGDEKLNCCISEKLKCICHYFRKVLQKPRAGVVTFKRRHMQRSQMPRWDKLENNLGNTKVHISSSGTIEDNGQGLLQVDFANKYVGGGVLGFGCVQEEIRFSICPELLLSRLFTEQLGNTECLIVIGAERYSNYSGYGETFTWNGNCDDDTPSDESGRKRTAIVAIDAQYFGRPTDQYDMSSILREVNKAYVGFFCKGPQSLPAVATGNWGCGAFRGDPHLKFLIQLMACSGSKRDMVYFTFGDDKLKDTLYNMYTFIATNGITVGHLWKLIFRFTTSKLSADQLYPFIQQAYFDSKNQLTIKQCFSWLKKDKDSEEGASTSSNGQDTDDRMKNNISEDSAATQISEDFYLESASTDMTDMTSSSSEDNSAKRLKKFKESTSSKIKENDRSPLRKKSASGSLKNDEEIINIINAIDGETFTKTEANFNESFLAAIDDATKTLEENNKLCRRKDENLNESMEVDDVNEGDSKNSRKTDTSEANKEVYPKRKITDYFVRKDK